MDESALFVDIVQCNKDLKERHSEQVWRQSMIWNACEEVIHAVIHRFLHKTPVITSLPWNLEAVMSSPDVIASWVLPVSLT